MKNRVIYGAILLALTVLCIFLSPVTRVLFFAAAAILCAVEYSRQMEKLEVRCSLWVLVTYLVVQAGLTLLRAGASAYAACFVGSVYLAFISGILRRKVSGNGALDTAAGLAYPCVLFGAIMVISVSDIWLAALALACLSTWNCDNTAFLVGRKYGKHKIAPHISPNKSVEGCVWGAVSSLPMGAVVWLLGRAFPGAPGGFASVPLWLCIVTAFAASTMGQLGDLAESLVKRMIGVKDFSELIPGHGGMLDRADSLLFSIPTAYFCLRLAGL